MIDRDPDYFYAPQNLIHTDRLPLGHISDIVSHENQPTISEQDRQELTKRLAEIDARLRSTLSSSSCGVSPINLIADELQVWLHLSRIDVHYEVDGERKILSSALEEEREAIDQAHEELGAKFDPLTFEYQDGSGQPWITATLSVCEAIPQEHPASKIARPPLLNACFCLQLEPVETHAADYVDGRIRKVLLQSGFEFHRFREVVLIDLFDEIGNPTSNDIHQLKHHLEPLITKLYHKEGFRQTVEKTGYLPTEMNIADLRDSFGEVQENPAARIFLAETFERFDQWLRRYLSHQLEELSQQQVEFPFFTQYHWILPQRRNFNPDALNGEALRLFTILSPQQQSLVESAAEAIAAKEKERLNGQLVSEESLISLSKQLTIDADRTYAGYTARTAISTYLESLRQQPLSYETRQDQASDDEEIARKSQERRLYFKLIIKAMSLAVEKKNYWKKDKIDLFFVPITLGHETLVVVQFTANSRIDQSDRRKIVHGVHTLSRLVELLGTLHAAQAEADRRREEIALLPRALMQNMIHDLLTGLKSGVKRSIREAREILEDDPTLVPDAIEELDRAEAAFDRCEQELKQKQSELESNSHSQRKTLEIPKVIVLALSNVRTGRYSHRMKFTTSTGWPKSTSVTFNEGLLSAIRDIVENAYDATASVDEPELKIDVNQGVTHPQGKQGQWLELLFWDNGSGLSEEFKQDTTPLFRYGFTTKHARSGAVGSGMGLYLVREFVEMHGGVVDFDTTVENGAKMFLILPLADSNVKTTEGNN